MSIEIGATIDKPIIPTTDAGNGERFAAMFGDRAKYVAGGWRIYNGRGVWEWDDANEVEQLAKQCARSIYKEAAVAKDSADSKALAEWAIKSESAGKLAAMLQCARSEPAIRAAAELFDANPMILCVGNGVVDLAAGNLRDHSPTDYCTRSSPVMFDPDARCEEWERVTSEWLRPEEVLCLKRAAGYSATGLTTEEVAFCLFGPEASGKTTTCEVVKIVLGTYAATADFETFLKHSNSNGGGARGDIARLAGTRFVSSSEADEGREFSEGLFKSITGGEKITARRLYKDEFEFLPQFKLWLAANHPPYIDPEDGASWRRIVRMPFVNTIPKERRDGTLKTRLLDPVRSGPGILNWVLDGCLQWQEFGLAIPQSVVDSTAELREQMDATTEFFEDRLLFDPNAEARAASVHAAYDVWCDTVGIQRNRRLGPKKLARKLESRGAHRDRDPNGNRLWLGVEVKL